jgi:hypothetical protein
MYVYNYSLVSKRFPTCHQINMCVGLFYAYNFDCGDQFDNYLLGKLS